MATSTFPTMTGAVDNTSAAVFIPEIWSDEVIAAYKSNLVLANHVRRMSMTGKKGDTIHIPKPTRGTAQAKAEGTAVTLQNATDTEVTITINKHYEYTRLIEDITKVQALGSLRQFYTSDAGYALAKQVDSDLFALGKSLGDGDGSDWTHSNVYFPDASTGLTTYAVDTVTTSDVVTDAIVRKMIQLLDDADVPMDGRVWVVPPATVNTLRGIDRYNSRDFVTGNSVNTGQVGDIYGVQVFVSSNCPTIETAAENSAGDAVRGSLFIHKDAFCLAEQMKVRSQTQYKQEFLADMYTSDTLYGTAVMRTDAGIVLAVNG